MAVAHTAYHLVTNVTGSACWACWCRWRSSLSLRVMIWIRQKCHASWQAANSCANRASQVTNARVAMYWL